MFCFGYKLHEIHKDIKYIMTALDDLNQAISDITISVSNEIAALESAKASSNDVAVEQAVTNLKALNTQLQNSVTPAQPAAPAQ